MAAVAIIGAQIRCIDSARDAARAAVRGESAEMVQQLAAAEAPAGAQVAVSYPGGGRVTVTVSAEIHALARIVPAMSVGARAVGVLEPGLAGDGGGG
jgi:hypothetical protein